MEMQLNPENLGKIYVQVTAKEGVVTAHLAVQNEIVKRSLRKSDHPATRKHEPAGNQG